MQLISKNTFMQTCPCGLNKAFDQCCGSIINKHTDAQTAEQLMRSRYTAFTLANIDYLMSSHHPKTRPIKEKKDILKWAESVKWLGLQILFTNKGSVSDEEGVVKFKALFIENGIPQELIEESVFVKENGKWFYVSGTHS